MKIIRVFFFASLLSLNARRKNYLIHRKRSVRSSLWTIEINVFWVYWNSSFVLIVWCSFSLLLRVNKMCVWLMISRALSIFVQVDNLRRSIWLCSICMYICAVKSMRNEHVMARRWRRQKRRGRQFESSSSWLWRWLRWWHCYVLIHET